MKKFLTWLIWLPIAVVFIVIALANKQKVTFSLDPTSQANPLFAVELPLFLLLFLTLVIGIIFGGVGAWLNQSKWRRAARDARYEMNQIRTEVSSLRKEQDEKSRDLVTPAA